MSNLKISANAHLIMPYHVLLDTAGEVKLGKLSLGTTRRGIGPCYADKALRLGIRVQDLLDEKILRTKIRVALEPKQQALRELGVQRRKLRKEAGEGDREAAEQAIEDAPDPRLDLHTMTEEHVSFGHRLEPHIADTSRLCWDVLDAGRTVIFEGAQATLLDLDHGTYPFVTSSNPIAGAATIGAGIGPADIDEVWGSRRLRDSGRRGPLPDRARRRPGAPHAGARPRVRHDDGARAALRLDGPGRPALRRAAEPDDLAGDHQARRAQRNRAAQGRGALSLARGGDPRHVPLPPVDPALGRGRVRGAARIRRGHRRVPQARPTCRPRLARTSTTSRISSASRSAWSASAPAASRSSGAAAEAFRLQAA